MSDVKFYECHWCDHASYTHLGRAYHIRVEHPRFFVLYDVINGWFSHKIPDAPEGRCEVEWCDQHKMAFHAVDTQEIYYIDCCAEHFIEYSTPEGGDDE